MKSHFSTLVVLTFCFNYIETSDTLKQINTRTKEIDGDVIVSPSRLTTRQDKARRKYGKDPHIPAEVYQPQSARFSTSMLMSDPVSPGLSAFKNDHTDQIPQTARLPVMQDMFMGDLALPGGGAFNHFQQSQNAGFSNQGYGTGPYGNQGYNTALHSNQEFFNQEHGNLGHSSNMRYIDTGYIDQGNIHSTDVSALCNNFDTVNLDSQAHVGNSIYRGEFQQRRAHASRSSRSERREPQSQTPFQTHAYYHHEPRSQNHQHTTDALQRWEAYKESNPRKGHY